MKKRLLFLAYFYPPLGGPGVQRPIKTIKYLKKFGWEIDVLTVSDIQFHSYDYELLKESRAENIYRTKSFDLMSILKIFNKKTTKRDTTTKIISNSKNVYFHTPEKIKKIVRGLFPIDDKIGWFPFAYKKALHLLRTKHYECIVATIGPYTTGVLAYQLHKKTNIPIIIDYRDLWTLHAYPQYIFRLLYLHAKKYEKMMLKSAKGVIIIGNKKKEILISHFGEYLREKIDVVYNGYDEDDFTENTSEAVEIKDSSQNITIRYVGNIYGNQSVYYFIQALEILKSKNEIPPNVIFEFIGNFYLETLNYLQAKNLSDYIKIIPQVNHQNAIKYMKNADLLLLLVSSKEGDSTIPGKVFEYIRACVPILAMIPINCETAEILKSQGHNCICYMEDIVGICKYLKEFFNSYEKAPDKTSTLSLRKRTDLSFDSLYSRENQTRIFYEFMEKTLYQ
ncbi:MAG: glycosyltransferase [Candidatus Cloacimonetes bacterium]|nr:glycosyltransferase [Candidatus Cloacimonadota bacterium]